MENELVIINPFSSLRFGGKVGRIVSYNAKELMPYRINFNGSMDYSFDRNEFMVYKEYLELIRVHNACKKCKSVLFSGECVNCKELKVCKECKGAGCSYCKNDGMVFK